jgi:hypothetical protein
VGAHTRLRCSARAGIKVSSHDPLQNYTDVLFLCGLFPWLSLHILSEDPYIGPIVKELPPEAANRITFEE